MKTTLKIFRPLNTIWHEKSQLVFKSRTEHVVIGKWVNEELRKLSSSDVTQCLNLKFKYDDNEVEQEEEKSDDKEVEQEEKSDDKESEDGEEGSVTDETKVIKEATKDDVVEDESEDDVEEATKDDVEEDGAEVSDDVVVEVIEEAKNEVTNNDPEVSVVTTIMRHKQSICNDLELLIGVVTKEVKYLEQEINNRINDFEKLLEEHNSLSLKFHDLENEHKKLQAKFDGIKQLFN